MAAPQVPTPSGTPAQGNPYPPPGEESSRGMGGGGSERGLGVSSDLSQRDETPMVQERRHCIKSAVLGHVRTIWMLQQERHQRAWPGCIGARRVFECRLAPTWGLNHALETEGMLTTSTGRSGKCFPAQRQVIRPQLFSARQHCLTILRHEWTRSSAV